MKQNFSVLDDGLLPSEYMISTLAVFFYLRDAQPTPKQLIEIRKWFWATGVGQRYSGRGFRENIKKDAEFFKRLATLKTARFVFENRVDRGDLKRTMYRQRSSMGDAMYCLLIRQKPTYLSNGQPMQVEEYASSVNRKHKHHIFPKSLLHRNGIVKEANSIVNLCFISAEENCSFGSQRPSRYLAEFKNKKYFVRMMKSHLIPCGENSGLWDQTLTRGYKTFINARTTELCKAFEREAGIKLFRATY